jgi:hypothetical protein
MWRGVCLTLVLLGNGAGLGRMSRSILIRYPIFFFQMVRDVFRVYICFQVDGLECMGWIKLDRVMHTC